MLDWPIDRLTKLTELTFWGCFWLTSKNLCQFCWLALKQKPQKPHFWDRNSSEFLTLSAIILLVCEHPDSLITNIVTLSGISISSWKNPALGGKTVKAECRVKIAFELCWTDGAASTESSLFELCRVVTEVDDHQCASCFAETEKQFINHNNRLSLNFNR